MNRYRKALVICFVGGLIMAGLMMIAGKTLLLSLIFGCMITCIAAAGMQLGLWVKST